MILAIIIASIKLYTTLFKEKDYLNSFKNNK